MKYAVVAGLLAISTAAAAPAKPAKPAKPPKLEPDDLPGPQPEVAPEEASPAGDEQSSFCHDQSPFEDTVTNELRAAAR